MIPTRGKSGSTGTTLSWKTRLANIFRRVFVGGPLERPLAWLSRRYGIRSWVARLVPLHLLYPHPSPRRHQVDDLTYQLDISRYVDWMLYFDRFDSPKEKLLGLARHGDIVMDIGCNIGALLLPLARAVGPEGRVYGFEPYPQNHEDCARNIGLNDLPNIDLHQFALGDRQGTLPFQRVDPRNPATNRVATEARPEDIQARVTTLDSFVKDNKIDRIDLIKIDVEGYELRVFRGGLDSLRRFQPTIFVEVNDGLLRAQGTSAAELLGFLQGLGYQFVSAESGTALGPADPMPPGELDIIARIVAS